MIPVIREIYFFYTFLHHELNTVPINHNSYSLLLHCINIIQRLLVLGSYREKLNLENVVWLIISFYCK